MEQDEQHPPPPPGTLFRFGAGFYLLVALAGVVGIGIQRRTIPLELFVDRGAWPVDLLVGAGAGILLLGAWWGLRRLVGAARRLEAHLRGLVRSLTVSEALGLALLSGFAEELLFRGAIQPAWGFWPATILFALLHTGRGRGLWLWTLSALVAGALFGLLFAWRGNLTAPVVAHALVNGVHLPRMVRETSAEERR